MCPMTLMTLKDDSLSETLSPIQLPWTVYIYGIDQLDYFQVKRRGSNRNREEWLPLSGFITRFAEQSLKKKNVDVYALTMFE